METAEMHWGPSPSHSLPPQPPFAFKFHTHLSMLCPHHVQAAFPAGDGTSHCHWQLLSSAKAEIPMAVLSKERNNCLKEEDKELSLSWSSPSCSLGGDMSKLQLPLL